MTARILKRRGGGGGFYNADGVTLKVDILQKILNNLQQLLKPVL